LSPNSILKEYNGREKRVIPARKNKNKTPHPPPPKKPTPKKTPPKKSRKKNKTQWGWLGVGGGGGWVRRFSSVARGGENKAGLSVWGDKTKNRNVATGKEKKRQSDERRLAKKAGGE